MKKVGFITETVIDLLQLPFVEDFNIYLGESNIEHMQSSHPQDYQRYGIFLEHILANPDYIGINPSNNSIEYVKEFLQNNEYVKVAVRISATSNRYYARSLYVLKPSRVKNFIAKGTLKKFDNHIS